MRQLDTFIKNNLDRFNDTGPPDGHTDRFAMKLVLLDKGRKRASLFMAFRIAAMVVVVFLISFLFFREYRGWNEVRSEGSIIASNQEVFEAERYYSDQLSLYYNQLEELEFQDNAFEKRRVLRELQEMDQQVEIMKEDLRQYPDNELIINAIINFYQIKIELMNDIIERVQDLNHSLL